MVGRWSGSSLDLLGESADGLSYEDADTGGGAQRERAQADRRAHMGGGAMNLKVVSSVWTGTHEAARQDVRYAVGEITRAPDWDPRPVCGGGLHYAADPGDYLPNIPDGGHLLEVEPVGDSVRVMEGGVPKSKCAALRVQREILSVPTPEEEPDWEVRMTIAERIPAERLERVPTPEEEPDEYVRRRIAYRIPADRLPARVPTLDEEPNASVRRRIAERICEREAGLGRK